MAGLVIHHPILTEEWIESNITDIEIRIFDHFEMIPLSDWEGQLDSEDFIEKYQDRTNYQCENWNNTYYFDYVYYKILPYVKNSFIDSEIYNKKIDTDELIDIYNQALSDAVDQLAFNVALSWALYLGCTIENDGGVKPYPQAAAC